MNRHSRIIMIFLMIVLISIGTAIIMFYINVGKDVESTSYNYSSSEEDRNQSSAYVFKDKSGLFGLRDSSGTVILEPEWTELTQICSDFFMAKIIVRSNSLYGVIDYKGDIIVPFVYSEIKQLSDYVYSAKVDDTGEYLFYGNNFELLFPFSADSYIVDDNNLCITRGEDKFTYSQGDEVVLIKAEMPRSKRPIKLELSVDDENVLSFMESKQWEDLGDKVILFLDAFRRNKTEHLSEITYEDALSEIRLLVEHEHLWKGKISDNAYFYTVDSSEKNVIYFRIELLIPFEDESEFQTVPLFISFKKNKTGEWLINDAFISDNL